MPILRITGTYIGATTPLFKRFFFTVLPILIFLFIPATASVAQGLSIGSSSIVSVGTGIVDLGCNNLDIASSGQFNLNQGQINNTLNATNAGTLNGNQGTLNLSGNWSNTGIFNAGTSTVNVTDGCANTISSLVGATTFFNLSVTTTSGKQLIFPAGLTQQVLGNLTLQGSAGNLLRIRSSTPGSPAFLQLALGGTQAISFVDVRDNHAPEPGQALAPGAAGDFNSVDSGGNLRWFLSAVASTAAIPTLSGFALLLLALLLLATTVLARRRV